MSFYKSVNVVVSLSLLMLLAACQSLSNSHVVGLQLASSGGIYKSPGDTREYRYLELDNQLKVLLIADATAEKAAASLDVSVGSRHDPEDRQGLAHFLEHMLFLGTQSYPQSDEYQKFISANGGSHNAYTSFEHTNYFFDINNPSLELALDRFADFFIAPLFDADYVQREVNAVESEYRSKIKDEQRRVLDATQQVINPQHPYHKFTVGGLETLSSGNVRDDMLDFYQQHYSASRMSLVVVGNYPLDELADMVRQRFAMVANNGSQAEPINEPLFSQAADSAAPVPQILAVQSEKPVRQLRFTFPMPGLLEAYRTKPLNYIGNILGHEGQGSLLSILKQAGWAEGLSTGAGVNYKGGASLQINISLTDAGVVDIKKVSDEVFYAINYLRQQHQERPGETLKLFLEQRQLAAMAFRFYQAGDEKSSAIRAASNLHFYPHQSAIYGDYDYSEYRSDIIADRLARMRADNVLITLLAPQLPEAYQPQQLSPWFAAPYSVNAVPENWLANWQQNSNGSAANTLAAQRFSLPAANNFIPNRFDLYSAEKTTRAVVSEDVDSSDSPAQQDIPQLLVDKPGMRAWFKTDDDFEVPKVDAYFSFLSRYPRQSARHYALSQLYSRVINEQLNEFVYPAYLAGMDYAFYSQLRGFTLRLGGYSDSLEPLVEKIIPALMQVDIDAERFQSVKAELARSWALAIEATPYQRLANKMGQALYANSWPEEDLIASLEFIAVADLQDYIQSFWSTAYIEGLLHGNINKQNARALIQSIEQLPNCQCDSEQRSHTSIVKLPAGRWQQQQDLNHSDAALVWYFQAADQTLATASMTMLAAEVLQPRVFNDLRTEQQLGYIVNAGYFSLIKWPGIVFQVQSPSTSEPDLVKAMNRFIENTLTPGDEQSVGQIPIEEFTQHRAALVSRLREKDANLNRRSYRYWRSLALGDTSFNRRRQLAQALEAVEYEQWLGFLRELLIDREASLMQISHRTKAAGSDSIDADSDTVRGADGPKAQRWSDRQATESIDYH